MWKKHKYLLCLTNIGNSLSPSCLCNKRYVHSDNYKHSRVSENGSVIADSTITGASCESRAETQNLPTLVQVIVRSISHSEYPRRIQWELPLQDKHKYNTKEDMVQNVEGIDIPKSKESLNIIEHNNNNNDKNGNVEITNSFNNHIQARSNSEYVSYRRSPYSLLRSRNERIGLCATRLLRNVRLELEVQHSSGKAANLLNDINAKVHFNECANYCEHCKSSITQSGQCDINSSAICCCLSLLYKEPILSSENLQPELRLKKNKIDKTEILNNSILLSSSPSSSPPSPPPTTNALKIMPSSTAAEEDSSIRYAIDTFILALHLSNTLELLLPLISKDDSTALFAGMNFHTTCVIPLCSNLTPHVNMSATVNPLFTSSKSNSANTDGVNTVEHDAIWSARLLLPIEEANHIRWLQNEHEHLRHCYSRAQSLRSLFVMESICTSVLVKSNTLVSLKPPLSLNQNKGKRALNLNKNKNNDDANDNDDDKINRNELRRKYSVQTTLNGQQNQVNSTNSIDLDLLNEKEKYYTKQYELEEDEYYTSDSNNLKEHRKKTERQIAIPLYISSELCNRKRMLCDDMSETHLENKLLSNKIIADNYYVYTTATPSLAEIRTVLERMHRQEYVISLVDIALLERWTLHYPELKEYLFTFAIELMNNNFSVLHETPSPGLRDFARLFAALIVEHYATHLLNEKKMTYLVDKADTHNEIKNYDYKFQNSETKAEERQSVFNRLDNGTVDKNSSQCRRDDKSSSSNNNWRTRHPSCVSTTPLQFLECCTKLIHLHSTESELSLELTPAIPKNSLPWPGHDVCTRLTSSVLSRLKQRCDAIASSCLLEATNVECNKWMIWLLQSNPATEHCMKQFRLLAKQSVSSAHSALTSSHLIPYAYEHLHDFVTVVLPLVVNSESEELFTIILNECLSHLELRVRELAKPFTEEELHLLAKIGNDLFDNIEASEYRVLQNVEEQSDDSVMWRAEELNVMDGGPWALCVSTCKALRKMLQSLIEDKEYLHSEKITNFNNSENHSNENKRSMLSSHWRIKESRAFSEYKELFYQMWNVRSKWKLDNKEDENAYNDLHHAAINNINSSTNSYRIASDNDEKKSSVKSEINHNNETLEHLHCVDGKSSIEKARSINRGEIDAKSNTVSMPEEITDKDNMSRHRKMKTSEYRHANTHTNSAGSQTDYETYMDCKKLYVSDAVRRRFLSLIESIVKQHVHLQKREITTLGESNFTNELYEPHANSLISKELFTFISKHVTVTNIHDEYRRKLFLLVNVSPREHKAHNQEHKEGQHEGYRVMSTNDSSSATSSPATLASKKHLPVSNVKTHQQASEITHSDSREVHNFPTVITDDAERIPVELRLLVNSLPFFFSSWASATILREVLAESAGNNPRYNYVLNAAINLQLPISTTRSRIASTLNMWRFINSQAEKLSWRESIRSRQRCIYNLPLSFILSSYWAFITWTCIAAIVLLNLCGIDYESNVVAQRLYNKFALWPELYRANTTPMECKDSINAKDEKTKCDLEHEQPQQRQQQELHEEELAAIETCKMYFSKQGGNMVATSNSENNDTISSSSSSKSTNTKVKLTDSATMMQESTHPRALTMVCMNNEANANIVLSRFSDALMFPFYVDVNKMMPLDVLMARIAARIRFITLSHCGFLSRLVIRFFPLERQAMQNNLITHTCIQADRWGRRITFLMYIHDNVTVTNGFVKALHDSVLAKRANLIVFVHERSLEDQKFDDTIVIHHLWEPTKTTNQPQESDEMIISDLKDYKIDNVTTAMLVNTIRSYLADCYVQLTARFLTLLDLFHEYVSSIREALSHSISRTTMTYNRLKGGMLRNTELRNEYLHALTFHQPPSV